MLRFILFHIFQCAITHGITSMTKYMQWSLPLTKCLIALTHSERALSSTPSFLAPLARIIFHGIHVTFVQTERYLGPLVKISSITFLPTIDKLSVTI